ncbi:substrate-binding domain-containing protein [Mangrovicoccus sp. HB161399]|uniref:substrate-binding domain-containing protein n=1 Tax=Mangrovicoccus sp. HB161399 TaxID=2720392 RepID=UPI001552627F|nr:substrate-binding domain-containing protein [Mangrovicoccus sp. HB161399]
MIIGKRALKGAVAAALLAAAGTAALAEGANLAVVGGRADDPFFAKVKRGIDDAAKLVEARGGSVNYLTLKSYDNIGADAAALIRTAVGQGADGIAAPNWVPDAQDPAFEAATGAGIPVILYNAGGGAKAEALGAINYVGSEESIAGEAAGRYAAEHGAKLIVCVNTVPGAANLEARCNGIEKGAEAAGAKGRQLPLPASAFGDPTAVSEAIKATLLQDPEVDAVVTVGSQDAASASSAIMQAGKAGQVMLGTFNLDSASLDRIREGTQSFAIDQQGYLQGFMSVFLLDSYVNYSMATPTQPILTGPAIVDASNIDATLDGVAAGLR